MAETPLQDEKKRRGNLSRKKLSTNVDLTPMVDLGFLLITFFVFTTELSHPVTMRITLPDSRKGIDSMSAPESKTLNLVLGGNDSIYYYNGINLAGIRSTDYSPAGIRTVLMRKEAMVKNRYGDPSETIVLIRPTTEASYRNVVDILDEMSINNISRYVLMDENPEHSPLLPHR